LSVAHFQYNPRLKDSKKLEWTFKISKSILWVLIAMADVEFNLLIEYRSKPRLFSKNSFIFTKTGSCISVKIIENTGVIRSPP
jgi:hypothetical protein